MAIPMVHFEFDPAASNCARNELSRSSPISDEKAVHVATLQTQGCRVNPARVDRSVLSSLHSCVNPGLTRSFCHVVGLSQEYRYRVGPGLTQEYKDDRT